MPEHDLLLKLRNLEIPTLVITGDHDFFPIEVAEHIALAIPDATLATLRNCGQFSYLECPANVRSALNEFLESTQQQEQSLK